MAELTLRETGPTVRRCELDRQTRASGGPIEGMNRTLGSEDGALGVSTREAAGSTPAGCLHHYVIVRADLPLGVMVAQTIHAAGETGPARHGTHAVALSVPSELDLERVEERLLEAGLPHVAVREPDAPWNNALMVIGIPPMDASNPNLRRIVRRLTLLKDPT